MSHMSHTCNHPSCSVEILPSWEKCKRHHREAVAQRKLAQKVSKSRTKIKDKRVNPLFDASGKVRANMGLARLKERDRLAWEAKRQAQESA